MLSKLAARQEVATAVRPVSGGRRRIEVRAEPDEAWLEVWREAEPKLRRLGAALGIDRHRIDDVLQDAYLAVLEAPERVEIGRAHV